MTSRQGTLGPADRSSGGAEHVERALDASADEGRHEPTRSERRRGRRRRRILVATLVLLLVPLVAVAGYLKYLTGIAESNITQADLLPPAVAASGVTESAPAPVVADGSSNYLFIGDDARPGDAASRSDVVILVHIPKDRSKIYLVHFPRDLYVPIPGRGQDKINAAYSYGDAPLLVQTLQNLLGGVRIDHVAKVDFDGFKRMTDAVGGVDVEVEESSNSRGQSFQAGTLTHMNGEQALVFVRERYQLSRGDISRGRRQMAFLKGLMLKALSPETLANPVRLAQFVDAATANLVVDRNLDVATMRSMAFSLRSVRGGDIGFVTAPYLGFATTSAGASIDVVDKDGMARLGTALRTDTMDTYR